jgi:aminopeptidase N
VADTCQGLTAAGGERARVALRNLAQIASNDEHFTALERAADGDTELQWRRLTRLAELGHFDAAATEALRERDPDPEAWARAVVVNAARPDAAAKEEAWRLVMEERRFPISGPLFEMGRAFWRPGQEDVLAPYPDRYLAALPGLSGAGMLAVMGIAATMFPVVAVDDDFGERALATADTADLTPLLSKRLIDQVDTLRRMVAARTRS